ncbi:uncharacterized protein LOC110441633 isoform X4 [Mizuhopecten yessoensis]|uniref:uncharacterized protein LOC110441633 isoform X4 n=1 Tax=Mizuhopecten yessoensis TaxID=6573 RepID=UPI000B45F2A2|nr:uncharacterized protein LOC110441633 isoform X4 [Mizuhopecten yessoensis]
MVYCRNTCQSCRTNMLSFLCVAVLCLAGTLVVSEDGKRDDSGFQLFFGTQVPQLPPIGGIDINCVDKQANCVAFGKEACAAPYDKWAKDNCANYCGFCHGATTPAPACVDSIKNCEAYGQTVCNDPKYGTWAAENCRYFCRKCTVQQLQIADSITTTISPEQCVDKVDCRLYGQSSCQGSFKGWAKENCRNFCGFCTGSGATPSPFVINPVPATSGPGFAVPNLPGRRNVPALRCKIYDYTLFKQSCNIPTVEQNKMH